MKGRIVEIKHYEDMEACTYRTNIPKPLVDVILSAKCNWVPDSKGGEPNWWRDDG